MGNLFDPSEEHALLRQSVRAFVQDEVEPQALQYDRAERFNVDLFRRLGTLGILGITAPESDGGAGMDATAAVLVHEELSAADPGFCLAFLAHSMLCVNNIAHNCSPEQRRRYLPKLCSGEWIGAMAMSEPGAGTDVLGMRTTATREGTDYLINGRKMWITNGTIDDDGTPCDVVYLYARSNPLSAPRTELSTFVIEASHAGFTVGQKIRDKAGMRASNTAELCFDQCRVSSAQLVGSEGQALSQMVRNLELERLTLAAMSLGIARRSLDTMVRYAHDRRAFGTSLTSFGQIQHHIAQSFAEYNAARTYVYHTAANIQLSKGGQRLHSDGVKLFAAQIGKQIADRAIQVLGGYGYVGEYVVERLWRDAKLLEIGGGTIEAHEKNITADLVKSIDSAL